MTAGNSNSSRLLPVSMVSSLGSEAGEAGSKSKVLYVLHSCNTNSFLSRGPTVENKKVEQISGSHSYLYASNYRLHYIF